MLKFFGRALVASPVAGLCASAICVCGVAVGAPAHASQTTYYGYDRMIDRWSARPNTDTTHSWYEAQAQLLGSEHTIDFETAPLGLFHSLDLGYGVTLTGTDYFGGDQVIRAGASPCVDALCGFNTTAGGARYLLINGGQITFNFATPISAFSFLMGGPQHDGISVDFSGEQQQYYVQGYTGLSHFGMTDPSLSVSSFTVDIGNDIVSLDDLTFTFAGQTPATPPTGGGGSAGVPEPSAWALMIVGFGGVGALLRRRARPSLAWLEFVPRH